MLKKISVIAALLLILGFSFNLALKTENGVGDNQAEGSTEEAVPDLNKIHTFSQENLPPACTVKNEQLCAVESAVKCTINPQLDGCSAYNLPKFIFMQDPELDRPTEISYKVTNKKNLINDTTEIYTDSACNGGWFGLCQGTVIYVLARGQNRKWFVKDIYAVE